MPSAAQLYTKGFPPPSRATAVRYDMSKKNRWAQPPWFVPPRSAENVFVIGGIAAPANGVQVPVLRYTVQPGFVAIITSIILSYQSPNVIPQVGDIVYTLTTNQPNSSTGYPLPNLGNVTFPVGNFSDGTAFPVAGSATQGVGIRVEDNRTIQVLVLTNSDFPAGSPNFILAGLFGYEYPISEEAGL